MRLFATVIIACALLSTATGRADTIREHALRILDRAATARQMASKALALDGTQRARDIAKDVQTCQDGPQACFQMAHDLERVSLTGAYAGLTFYDTAFVAQYFGLRDRGMPLPYAAILAHEADVAAAEHFAKAIRP